MQFVGAGGFNYNKQMRDEINRTRISKQKASQVCYSDQKATGESREKKADNKPSNFPEGNMFPQLRTISSRLPFLPLCSKLSKNM